MKRIAIVGGAPSTKDLAPFNTDWEIWVLANQINSYEGKRVDRVFEIHENLEEHGDVDRFWEYVKRTDAPFIVSEKYKQYGDVFPYEEAKALMGSELLTSSPSYMMAYALLQGVTEIGIYGVEMALNDHEYFKQRPAMYAWIGFAKAKGVKITIPKESTLFNEQYCEGRDWGKRDVLGYEYLMEQAKIHSDKEYNLAIERATHDGAKQAYESMAKVRRSGVVK